MLSLEQGKKLVQAAREVVNSKFENKTFELKGFEEKAGVFVTLHSYPEEELKGCIGFTEPIFPLNQALVRVARAAAFSDSRFAQIQQTDLDNIVFEVSILTNPKKIEVTSAENYKKEIIIGQDGLVAESQGYKGLLLPQVASEHKMDQEQFLCCTCEKAGLPSEAWKDIQQVKISKFQAQIFKEIKPKGTIVETKAF